MSLNMLIKPFPWAKYSKKLASKIDKPRSVGVFTKDEADACVFRFAAGVAGNIEEGNIIYLYSLVDPADGVIVDLKFQLIGESALIGAGEGVCDLAIGRNYDQASRLSIDLVDKHFRDKNDVQAFPEDTLAHVGLALEALQMLCKTCMDIPLAKNYVAPPIAQEDMGLPMAGEGYPGWKELPLAKKIAVIEDVIDREIRPYIEMDAGGVEVISLKEDREVIIAYQGTCTTCFSATGATLSFIQQVLRARIDPDLEVTPDL